MEELFLWRKHLKILRLIMIKTNFIRLTIWVLKKLKKIEWRKLAFKCELKNTYGVENRNDTARIHDYEVNKIAEWNLLHDIINPTKRTKKLNIHYSPILMNLGIL